MSSVVCKLAWESEKGFGLGAVMEMEFTHAVEEISHFPSKGGLGIKMAMAIQEANYRISRSDQSTSGPRPGSVL